MAKNKLAQKDRLPDGALENLMDVTAFKMKFMDLNDTEKAISFCTFWALLELADYRRKDKQKL
jgi:chromatin segregation and condensation protein Rec8/ScpA/Scc1 (kleisin family)